MATDGYGDDGHHGYDDFSGHGCGDPNCRPLPVRVPEGTTFTHRLTAAEVDGDFVAFGLDLEPLEPLLEPEGLPLLDGAVAELDVHDDGGEVLLGPPGWLPGARAGDLVGFRLVGDDVEVVTVTRTSTPDRLGEHLRWVFDRQNGGDGMPVPVVELIHGAVAELVDVDRISSANLVLPPVSELLTHYGFEVRDSFAAPAGADWDGFRRISLGTRVAGAHGLGVEQAHLLVVVAELFRLFAEGKRVFDDRPSDVVHEIAQHLADPPMGEAFVDLALAGPHAGDLDRFFDALAEWGARNDSDGLVWLRSIVARRTGDHDRAEKLLRKALVADPEHWEVLEDAAWYASDRGDARLAVSLLDRLAGLGDDEAELRAAVLRPHACAPAAGRGRNEPCPCGSGQKYKRCCLSKEVLAPLPERVRWIWEKLDWYLSRSGFDDSVEDAVEALGANGPTEVLLATSLVLFQDEVVDEFLAERGRLLPHDEWNLLSQWALVEPSVNEVVGVAPGDGVTLRDVRSGDVRDVRERLGSTGVAVGDLLFAHVVPDGVGHQFVGGIVTIPFRLRDPLIAALDDHAEAVQIAALMGQAADPPEVVTMEREPMVLCEARYRISDPAATVSLDAVLDRGDGMTWSQSIDLAGRRWVRGTVAVANDELVVTANSEARFSRIRDRVEAAVPGLELLAATATPAAQALTARAVSPDSAAAHPLPPDAERAVAAFVREQEERWVDESIPALGGLTPRQAAADPTRREELVALLHDFDRHPLPPGAASFDTGRLRRALGLNR